MSTTYVGSGKDRMWFFLHMRLRETMQPGNALTNRG